MSSSYTHEQLLATIAKQPRFSNDFTYLPRGGYVKSDSYDWEQDGKEYIGYKRIMVGHTTVVDPPRCVWAYAKPDHISAKSSGDCIRFGLYALDAIPEKCSVDLRRPFKEVAESRTGHWWDNIHSLVLFYFLEKRWVQNITLSEEQLKDFESACRAVAARAQEDGRQPARQALATASQPTIPADSLTSRTDVPDGHGHGNSTQLPVKRKRTELKDESDSNTAADDGVAAGLAKRSREDKTFAEYQALVDRIRQNVSATNAELKHEVSALKLKITRMKLDAGRDRVDQRRTSEALNRNRDKIAQLENELQTSNETSAAANARVEQLKKELEELKDFKQKVKTLL